MFPYAFHQLGEVLEHYHSDPVSASIPERYGITTDQAEARLFDQHHLVRALTRTQ